MRLVANARMYSATPQLADDWKRLLHAALRHAQLDWDVIDYPAPASLNTLWARGDLGLALMCGLPYAQRASRLTAVAAPVPAPQRYGGQPLYWSDIVVRADAPFTRLEDTFGGIVGYTLADSMSGGVAFQDHLSAYRQVTGKRLYRATVGGLVHARGVIEALAAGRIDVGPLDSYYHDLLRHNDPAFAAQVRTIDRTAARPMPLFVATAPLPSSTLERLRTGLRAAVRAPQLRGAMQRLLLADFAVPQVGSYGALAQIAQRAHLPFEEL